MKYFSTIGMNLELKIKESRQEDQRNKELKTNIKLLHENTTKIILKTKKIEAHTEKIRSDSGAINEELIR